LSLNGLRSGRWTAQYVGRPGSEQTYVLVKLVLFIYLNILKE